MRVRINEPDKNAVTGRIDDACRRYGLGRNTLRQIAKEAGATIHIGRTVLFNFMILDEYLNSLSE